MLLGNAQGQRPWSGSSKLGRSLTAGDLHGKSVTGTSGDETGLGPRMGRKHRPLLSGRTGRTKQGLGAREIGDPAGILLWFLLINGDDFILFCDP